jgi:hypothetical protein
MGNTRILPGAQKPNDSDGIANATGTESEGFNKRNSSGEPKLVDTDFVLS